MGIKWFPQSVVVDGLIPAFAYFERTDDIHDRKMFENDGKNGRRNFLHFFLIVKFQLKLIEIKDLFNQIPFKSTSKKLFYFKF